MDETVKVDCTSHFNLGFPENTLNETKLNVNMVIFKLLPNLL